MPAEKACPSQARPQGNGTTHLTVAFSKNSMIRQRDHGCLTPTHGLSCATAQGTAQGQPQRPTPPGQELLQVSQSTQPLSQPPEPQKSGWGREQGGDGVRGGGGQEDRSPTPQPLPPGGGPESLGPKEDRAPRKFSAGGKWGRQEPPGPAGADGSRSQHGTGMGR